MKRRNRRPWAAIDGGYGGAGLASSSMANECPRCGDDIRDWGDACKTSGGRWIHKRCASGGDDE